MSAALCLIGLGMIYWSCRVIARIDQPRMNRRFRSWFSEKLNKEDAQSYRTVNGLLIALAILFGGVFMLVLGIAYLFLKNA